MRNKAFLILVLFLIMTKKASAAIFMGYSGSYSNINDNRFKSRSTIGESINFGYAKSFDNWRFSLTTNRLLIIKNKDKIMMNSGQKMSSETKTKLDSLSLGRSFGRMTPGIFIANVNAERNIFSSSYRATEKESAIIYGVNLNYLLNKKISIGAALVAPSKALNLEASGAINFNYFF